MRTTKILAVLTAISLLGCSTNKPTETVENEVTKSNDIKLITLDPGHFHAALVQKAMYENVDSVVHVFAPEGNDVREHLKKSTPIISARRIRRDGKNRFSLVRIIFRKCLPRSRAT